MLQALNWLGRALGLVCGAALASAWALTLWVPSAGLALTGISVITALLLIAFAVFAGVAAVHGHGLVVALLFLASFFPIGVFLMPLDHWLHWVGWVDLGLLLAAILLFVTGRARANVV
jgi:ABC-type glycerol-3-phosphate transport system permease component